MKNVIVSQVETIDWVSAITAVLKKRLTSDIASIGGAEFESYLSYNLSNKKYKVLTQKMIETLQRTDRAQLYFGDYTFPELMEESHHIGSDFYAVDLFAFTKDGDQYYYEDHISLKTSVSATDSSMFLVNDAEGVIVPSVLWQKLMDRLGRLPEGYNNMDVKLAPWANRTRRRPGSKKREPIVPAPTPQAGPAATARATRRLRRRGL